MSNEKITFTIPGIPPSQNHAIKMTTRGGYVRRYSSKELKTWQELVAYTTNEQQIVKSTWYGIDITYYLPLFYKNGNIRRKDIDNMIKYTIDSILERVKTTEREEIDDRQIKELKAQKKDGEERTDIILYIPS